MLSVEAGATCSTRSFSSTGEGLRDRGSLGVGTATISSMRPEVLGVAQCMEDLTEDLRLRQAEYLMAMPAEHQES